VRIARAFHSFGWIPKKAHGESTANFNFHHVSGIWDIASRDSTQKTDVIKSFQNIGYAYMSRYI